MAILTNVPPRVSLVLCRFSESEVFDFGAFVRERDFFGCLDILSFKLHPPVQKVLLLLLLLLLLLYLFLPGPVGFYPGRAFRNPGFRGSGSVLISGTKVQAGVGKPQGLYLSTEWS